MAFITKIAGFSPIGLKFSTQESSTKGNVFKTEIAANVSQSIEKTIKINGLSINYLEAGHLDSPTVILIHGIGSSKNVWTKNIEGGNLVFNDYRSETQMQKIHLGQFRKYVRPLSGSFHVIAPDLPGFGNSEKPRENLTQEYLVNSFMPGFISGLKISKMHLVGISMGGAVATGYSLSASRNAEIETLHLICSFGLKPHHLSPIAALALWNPIISEKGILMTSSTHFGGYLKEIYHILGKIGQSSSNMDSLMSYFESMNTASLQWLSDQVRTKDLVGVFRKVQHGSEPLKTDYSSSMVELSKKIRRGITFYHDRNDPIIPFVSSYDAHKQMNTVGLKSFLVTMNGVDHQVYKNPGYLSEQILGSISRS